MRMRAGLMLPVLTSPMSGILRDHQENRYPHPTLWINGRTVSIEKVLHGSETIYSPFEDSTFRFIKEWLSGQDNFVMTTSGSTGEPKTISISRGQMMVSAQLTFEKISLQKVSSALVCIDTNYIGGKMMLARCLT